MIDARRCVKNQSHWRVIVDTVGVHTSDSTHDVGRVGDVSAQAEHGELNGLRDYREPCQDNADEEAEDFEE